MILKCYYCYVETLRMRMIFFVVALVIHGSH
jgi:hypothetical protein